MRKRRSRSPSPELEGPAPADSLRRITAVTETLTATAELAFVAAGAAVDQQERLAEASRQPRPSWALVADALVERLEREAEAGDQGASAAIDAAIAQLDQLDAGAVSRDELRRRLARAEQIAGGFAREIERCHQRRREALDKHAGWLRKAALAGDPALAEAARGRADEWAAIAADREHVLAEHAAGRQRLALAIEALRAAITRERP